MVRLQLKDLLELFLKGRELLPGSRRKNPPLLSSSASPHYPVSNPGQDKIMLAVLEKLTFRSELTDLSVV